MSSPKSKKPVAKSETHTTEQNQTTLKKVGGMVLPNLANKLTETQLNIGKTLSEVNGLLQVHFSELEDVQRAVNIKQEELQAIYSKELALKSIDELNVDLEAHKQKVEDEKLTLDRQRQQEEANFTFELEQQRKNDEIAYEEERRALKNKHRDEDELREKTFKAREEALAKQEGEFKSLQEQVSKFPELLSSEVKKHEAIKENSVKREYEHKLELQNKTAEAAATVANNTISSLKAENANQAKLIDDLTKRLASSEEKVSTIATKALDAASKQQSMADIQSFIQQQSTGQTPKRA